MPSGRRDKPSSSSQEASTSNSGLGNGDGMDVDSIGSRNSQASLNEIPAAIMEGCGWQGMKSNVLERLGHLFRNSLLSDITFLVGKEEEQQRIPAHKLVLSMSSAVFDAMFNGGLAGNNESEITIPDIDPASFLVFLRFIYTDEFEEITHNNVMTVLYAAKKYAVPALQSVCVDFLKKNLKPDNAFLLLTEARLFDEHDLANLCLEVIDMHTSEALNADGFLELDYRTLSSVLQRESLHIREIVLFNAIDKWAEQECVRRGKPTEGPHKREVLQNALDLIRFPVMTIEEFAAGPAQSGILTDKEVKDLFLYFTLNPKPEIQFLNTPRSCLGGKEYTVGRFQNTENRWGFSGNADRIRFLVDRQIYVSALGLYGSVHGPAEYTVNLQIILSSNQRVIAQNETTFSSDGTEGTFRVAFKKPVEIQPAVHYTISACIKGPDSYYGTRGMRKVVKNLANGQPPVTFSFVYSPGNNNGTSVEDGQIPEIMFYLA